MRPAEPEEFALAEACIERDDIDLEAGTVTVTAQLVRVTRKQDPKGKGGWARAAAARRWCE